MKRIQATFLIESFEQAVAGQRDAYDAHHDDGPGHHGEALSERCPACRLPRRLYQDALYELREALVARPAPVIDPAVVANALHGSR